MQISPILVTQKPSNLNNSRPVMNICNWRIPSFRKPCSFSIKKQIISAILWCSISLILIRLRGGTPISTIDAILCIFRNFGSTINAFFSQIVSPFTNIFFNQLFKAFIWKNILILTRFFTLITQRHIVAVPTLPHWLWREILIHYAFYCFTDLFLYLLYILILWLDNNLLVWA